MLLVVRSMDRTFILVILNLCAGKQFCLTDSFRADCSDKKHNVVLMQNAEYGRMELGTCITMNLGTLGCSQDVLNLTDLWCSGKTHCEFSVSNPALVRTKPCPKDFIGYLEASYTCVEVLHSAPEDCKKHGFFLLEKPFGYISPMSLSHVRHEKHCPMVIRASPGQRINFTLLDFALRNNSATKHGVVQFCQQYAIIKEPGISSSVTLCSVDEREKEAYISRTHEVEIDLTRGESASFLLKYEVVGCARLKAHDGAYAKYDYATLTVVCNISRETFTLKCANNTWHGDLKNCTIPAEVTTDAPSGSAFISLPPLGISIVIILGVALVIVVYVAIMIVCVLYIKKKRRRHVNTTGQQPEGMCPPPLDMDGKLSDRCPGQEERLPMLTKAAIMRANGGEYTDICEMHNIKPCAECGNKYLQDTMHAVSREDLLSHGGSGIYVHTDSTHSVPANAQVIEAKIIHQRPPQNANQVQSSHTLTFHPSRTSQRMPGDNGTYGESPYGFPPCYFQMEAPRNVVNSTTDTLSPDLLPEYNPENATVTRNDKQQPRTA